MPVTCGSCVACVPIQEKAPDGSVRVIGQCHLLPPQSVPSAAGVSFAFPLVRPMVDWCGQWEPRPGFDAEGERVDQTAPPPKGIITE